MAVDVHPSIWVNRPRHEVADYVFNPLHEPAWMANVTEVRPDQPGQMDTGHTYLRRFTFLGRTWESTYVVTSHKPDHLVEIQTDWPFPTTIRYELTRGSDGTAVSIRAHGTPGRFFGLFTPLLNWWAHRSISADLNRLKTILES